MQQKRTLSIDYMLQSQSQKKYRKVNQNGPETAGTTWRNTQKKKQTKNNIALAPPKKNNKTKINTGKKAQLQGII